MRSVFRLSPQIYLERFDDVGLLLVAEYDRLLTVNAAAVELFAGFSNSFGSNPFTLEQGVAWLAGHYELGIRECRAKALELLAFGLRHGLVRRV